MSIGRINIQTVNARLEIQATLPTIDMKQQHAQVQIETEQPKVIIDQTECFNNSGLKNNTALMEKAVNDAIQNVSKYIETTVSDGQLFAAIENPEDTSQKVGQIAFRNMLQEHDSGIDSMPAVRPKIDVIRGTLNIDFTPKDLGVTNGVIYNVNLGKIYADYTPGKVTINYEA